MNIESEITKQGFQIINVGVPEMLKLGGLCICDSCNNAMFKGTFIGALNRVYCPECYTDWHENATYYEEDKPYETRIINSTLKKLKP